MTPGNFEDEDYEPGQPALSWGQVQDWLARELATRPRFYERCQWARAATAQTKRLDAQQLNQEFPRQLWQIRAKQDRFIRPFIITGRHLGLRAKLSQTRAAIRRRKSSPERPEPWYGFNRIPARHYNRRTDRWADKEQERPMAQHNRFRRPLWPGVPR